MPTQADAPRLVANEARHRTALMFVAWVALGVFPESRAALLILKVILLLVPCIVVAIVACVLTSPIVAEPYLIRFHSLLVQSWPLRLAASLISVLVGGIFYFIREWRQMIYGLFEVGIGGLGCWSLFASNDTDGLALKLAALVYIVVRGLDNIAKGSKDENANRPLQPFLEGIKDGLTAILAIDEKEPKPRPRNTTPITPPVLVSEPFPTPVKEVPLPPSYSVLPTPSESAFRPGDNWMLLGYLLQNPLNHSLKKLPPEDNKDKG